MVIETNLILGYPDALSVAAGERIRFHLSSAVGAVDARVVRLRCADSDGSGPGLRYRTVESTIDGRFDCPDQPLRAGSCAVVDDRGSLAPRGRFSVGCFAWPTRPTAEPQTLMSRWCGATGTGWSLEITRDGGLRLTVGDGARRVTLEAGTAIETRAWYWLSAAVDLEAGRAAIHQVRLADHYRPDAAVTRTAGLTGLDAIDSGGPLVIAGRAADLSPLWFDGHFDGRIEAPRLLARWAGAGELAAMAVPDRSAVTDPDLLAYWDFADGIDTLDVTDRSPWRHDGRLHQMPTRAVTGRHWSGRYHDWRLAPQEYAAIHFHTDDLADCGWDPVLTLDVPADWRSGLYALRLQPADRAVAPGEEPEAESFVTFFVTPAKGRAMAPLVVVAAAATYVAYANSALRLYHVHFERLTEAVLQLTMDDKYLLEHPELAQSTYDSHVDGSGRAYSSWRRPILNMRPRANPFNLVTDTHFLDWLEEKGIDYDLITDIELDRQGVRALAPYRAAVTLSHPEYYSEAMMQALLSWQNQGGRHLCLGANGFYWRCGFHPQAPHVLEVRRGISGTRTWESAPGEVHLAGTGEPGSLWRHSGFAPQKLVGAGFAAMVYDRPGWFLRMPDGRDPRAAFIVEGIAEGERIGDFGVRIGGAVGIEIDRYDLDLGTPRHALLVATSEGLGPGSLPSPEEFRTTVHGLDGEQNALVRADMVFFETAGGGAVFTTGSISYVLSLSCNGYDNNVSRLTGNVLRRFLDPAPFAMPA